MKFNFKEFISKILIGEYDRQKEFWEKSAQKRGGQVYLGLTALGMTVHISGERCVIKGYPSKEGKVYELYCHIDFTSALSDKIYITSDIKAMHGIHPPAKTGNYYFDKQFKVFCSTNGSTQLYVDDYFQQLLINIFNGQDMAIEIDGQEKEMRIEIIWKKKDMAPTFEQFYPDLEKMIKNFSR